MFESRIAEDILAEHLVRRGAVSFLLESPMRLKSGLVTPIYVDNRKLTAYPDAWRDIVETAASRIHQLELEFDVVAGVEGAGVSHAAALAYRLGKPSIFVRQQPKTYGNRSRVEGADVKGKRVLIIEDHISTGLSLLSAIEGLKSEGAIVTDCLAITSFGMDETRNLFRQENGAYHFQGLVLGALRPYCSGQSVTALDNERTHNICFSGPICSTSGSSTIPKISETEAVIFFSSAMISSGEAFPVRFTRTSGCLSYTPTLPSL